MTAAARRKVQARLRARLRRLRTRNDARRDAQLDRALRAIYVEPGHGRRKEYNALSSTLVVRKALTPKRYKVTFIFTPKICVAPSTKIDVRIR